MTSGKTPPLPESSADGQASRLIWRNPEPYRLFCRVHTAVRCGFVHFRYTTTFIIPICKLVSYGGNKVILIYYLEDHKNFVGG